MSITNQAGVTLLATGEKNILINSGFVINNGNAGVPYVSGATLTAGQTGHECWKVNGNTTYTFTQSKANTQITITSGSLIQVIEDVNVQGTTYTLSWTGTAQARAGVNSATPSGSYVSSPLVITGQTPGQTLSIEFNSGTLSNPQLELGSVATAYEYKRYQQELEATERYAETLIAPASTSLLVSAYYAGSYQISWIFKTTKYAIPSFVLVSGAWQGEFPSVWGGRKEIHMAHANTAFYLLAASDSVAAIALARL